MITVWQIFEPLDLLYIFNSCEHLEWLQVNLVSASTKDKQIPQLKVLVTHSWNWSWLVNLLDNICFQILQLNLSYPIKLLMISVILYLLEAPLFCFLAVGLFFLFSAFSFP